MKDFIAKLKLTKPFKSDESRFKLLTGFKVMMIPFLASLFVAFCLAIILKMNHYFFEVNGFSRIDIFKEAYYDYIFSEVSEYYIYVGFLYIGLFFVGTHLGGILLRPFEDLGKFCTEAGAGSEVEYKSDFFSEIRLLTRFSDFFFSHVTSFLKDKSLKKIEIPKSFSRVHGPVFDKAFFLHFCIFLGLITTGVLYLVFVFAVEIHSGIVELSINTLDIKGDAIMYFLQKQSAILNQVLYVSSFFLIISYLILAFHLYNKVSGAAFGVFSTMRSFLKGNHKARVHLIGYPHVRPYTIQINKFLDHIVREID